MSNLVSVGILSYNDLPYLKQLLPTLVSQTHQNLEILICDNHNQSQDLKQFLETEYPQVILTTLNYNAGFGNAHNHLISLSKGDFYLCLNSDTYLDSTFIENLLATFQLNSKIAAVTGKLLQWKTFPQNPTLNSENFIDSLGLTATSSHFFAERAQNQKDINQFPEPQPVFGAAGTAPLYKISALKDVAHTQNEYFDKLFFMYKEDIDLSYRLNWAGYLTYYTPQAIAWHDRTISTPKSFWNSLQERRNRPVYVKENSFLNHLMLIYKNYSWGFSLKTHLFTTVFLLQYILFLLIFDFKTLKVLKTFKQNLPSLKQKRRTPPKAVSPQTLESLFN